MFDWLCDETDLQGIMLFKTRQNVVNALIQHLQPAIEEEQVHIETQKVRGGTIIAFSLSAIAENRLAEIIAETGEEPQTMSFHDKIDNAFDKVVPLEECAVESALQRLKQPGMHISNRNQVEFKAGDLWSNMAEAREQYPDSQSFAKAVGEAWDASQNRFVESATKIAEQQYKSATAGSQRANQDTRKRQSYTSDTSIGGVEHQSSPRAHSERTSNISSNGDDGDLVQTQSSKGADNVVHGASKGPEARFEHRVARALNVTPESKRSEFNRELKEALDGIATPTGAQPDDLFKKFARALRVLGQQMGFGPLQDRLREQGIQWKKSDDNQAIILYIQNATTGAPQPIARVSHETLSNPSDFEQQLTHMLDFSTGDAPGAFQQKQQEVKDQEKAVRDIAKAITPQDQESEVARQMNDPSAAQPVVAGQAAASQAAMPKQQHLAAGKIPRPSLAD